MPQTKMNTKSFISVREFVESWEKELYELTNLDFFIYQMMNTLGRQLQNHFFKHQNDNLNISLDFDEIGTLCFNLGDSFEYFLEENCFHDCQLNCPLDLEKTVNFEEFTGDDPTRKRLMVLRSFLSPEMVKEQCLRVELMNSVVLDSLMQFFSEEKDLELHEDNLGLIDLADFIEESIVSFIRHEGQNFLEKPFDPAINLFEDLIEKESFSEGSQWEDETDWDMEETDDFWMVEKDVNEIIDQFIEERGYSTPREVEKTLLHLNLLKEFLREKAGVVSLNMLEESHLLEFMAYWLVRKFALENENKLPDVFTSLAQFVNWLSGRYHLDFKKSFLSHYEKVKMEVPRVVRTLNLHLKEYNLFEALLSGSDSDAEIWSGYFEITNISSPSQNFLDLSDIRSFRSFEGVYLKSAAFSGLRKADILQATLVKRDDCWEVQEIEYIYPRVAKLFLHEPLA